MYDSSTKNFHSHRNIETSSCDNISYSAGIIEVKAMSEDTFIPNRVKGIIFMKCIKKSVIDVQSSMSKRINYVLQVFSQNKIKHEDFLVNKHLSRLDDRFCLTTDIIFTMSRLDKYEEVTNLLTEKLKSMITVCSPEFFYSKGELDRCRLRVCVQAVENAKAKAILVATALNQKLGKPISVNEESFKEWKKRVAMQVENPVELIPDFQITSLHNKVDSATVVMQSQVAIKFTLIS